MILKPLSEEYKSETLRMADAKFKRGSLDWLNFIVDRALEDFASQIVDRSFNSLYGDKFATGGIVDLLKQHTNSPRCKL